jgi:site-specific DNA recombinase
MYRLDRCQGTEAGRQRSRGIDRPDDFSALRRARLSRIAQSRVDRLGVVSKRREGAGGALSGGKRFSRGALHLMLQNRLYRGEVAHKEKIYPGQHEAIIDPELWQIVQDQLEANRQERSLAVGAEAPSLLSGLIVDSDVNRMTPTHAVKNGKRYRYYVSTALVTGSRSENPKGRRIPAGDIEGLVLDRLRSFFSSRTNVADALAPLDLDAHSLDTALRNASALSERWLVLPPIEMRSLVRDLVEQVIIAADRIDVHLNRVRIAAALETRVQGEPNLDPVTLSIEAKLRRAGKGRRLIIANGAGVEVNQASSN